MGARKRRNGNGAKGPAGRNASSRQDKDTPADLVAVNEQLRAALGQLQAANQQLAANQEQLQAANRLLMREQSRAQAYLSVAGVILVVIDADEKIQLLNRKGCELLGVSEGDAVGKNWFETFVPARLRDDLRTVFRELMAGHVEIVEYVENPVVTAQGEERLIAWHNTLLRDESGAIVGTLSSGEDITEREKAHQAVREADAQWQKTFDALGDSVAILDEQGRFVRINAATCRLLGKTREQIIGKTCFQVIHGTNSPIPECPLVRMRGSLRRESMVLPIGDRDFRVTVDPILSGGTRLTGILHVLTDITDLVRIEETLRASEQQLRAANQQLRAHEQQLRAANAQLAESEAQYRSIIEHLPMGVHMYRLEPDGRLVFTGANPAADTILGVANAQFIGKTIEEAFKPLAHTEVPERYRAAARDGTVWRTEHIDYQDEQIRGAFEVTAFQNGPGRMIAVFQDITQRKKAEEALRREHALVSAIMESSPLAIAVVNTAGEIVFANAPAERGLGLSRSGITERTYNDPRWEITALDGGPFPDDQLPFVRVMRTGEAVFDVRHAIRHPDGTRVPLAIHAAPLRGDDGSIQGMVATIQDISLQLRMEEDLRNRQRLESLGVLAGGIAHDFNNLLAGVFGYVDMARHLGAIDATAREYLDRAMESFQRARALTQQLLTFSKGGAPLKKLIAIERVIREAASLATAGTTARCEFDIPADLPAMEADEGQIGQVVTNMVINARQAMAGGGTVFVGAAHRTVGTESGLPLAPGHYVEITIRDTGVGIPAEHLSKIFDPFFTTKQQGSGLGLAISYSIVSQHGGHITVESQPGAGTTFRVYLPCKPGTVVQDSSGTAGAEVGLARGRVLVMDDEPLVRTMACKMLESLGYQAVGCATGEEAVALYRAAQGGTERFSVVILDLTVFAGAGGIEAMKRILEIDPCAYGVVSSGYADNQVLANYRSYGFAGAIAKPYRLEDLRRELDAAVRRGRKAEGTE